MDESNYLCPIDIAALPGQVKQKAASPTFKSPKDSVHLLWKLKGLLYFDF